MEEKVLSKYKKKMVIYYYNNTNILVIKNERNRNLKLENTPRNPLNLIWKIPQATL